MLPPTEPTTICCRPITPSAGGLTVCSCVARPIQIFFPVVALCFWQFFTDATSPYLMLINLLVVNQFHSSIGGRIQKFYGEAISLEFYHCPRWFLRLIRVTSRGMGTYQYVAEAPLRAAAERRAAHLREQMMIADADATSGRGGGGGGNAAESRTRRHLRFVAATS